MSLPLTGTQWKAIPNDGRLTLSSRTLGAADRAAPRTPKRQVMSERKVVNVPMNASATP